jgi:hypothetical protein
MSSNSKNSSDNDMDDDADFNRVRKYLQTCPDVPPTCRAIQAALAGLDLEWKRIERDAKLKRKFSSASTPATATTATATTIKMENERLATYTDTNTTGSNTNMLSSSTGKTAERNDDDDDELMGEWQDVVAQEPQSSLLGAQLAQMAVAVMAQHQVSVKTPLAAIALALHTSLVSDVMGLACTGVPDPTANTKKGFAPPIRELPKGQLLPTRWDEPSPTGDDVIRLRYRKPAVGSVVLTVTLTKDQQVQVDVTPTSTNEPPLQQLVFPLDDHINLESFQKALANSSIASTATATTKVEGSVLPALHYKALPTLLSKFANTMDVGSIRESSETPNREYLPYVDATAISSHATSSSSSLLMENNPLRIPSNHQQQDERVPGAENCYPPPPYNPYQSPTIDVFQPAVRQPHRGGDFAGDLYPPVGHGGDFMDDNTGNLLGPNHPMFAGRGGNVGIGGAGYGMRPRFDPFGPPGGPQEDPTIMHPPPPPLRRPPPPSGGSGDPNPDHLRPPNNLSNMFL